VCTANYDVHQYVNTYLSIRIYTLYWSRAIT